VPLCLCGSCFALIPNRGSKLGRVRLRRTLLSLGSKQGGAESHPVNPVHPVCLALINWKLGVTHYGIVIYCVTGHYTGSFREGRAPRAPLITGRRVASALCADGAQAQTPIGWPCFTDQEQNRRKPCSALVPNKGGAESHPVNPVHPVRFTLINWELGVTHYRIVIYCATGHYTGIFREGRAPRAPLIAGRRGASALPPRGY
jgi:hypothetical protein